jgi:hypothetical protein
VCAGYVNLVAVPDITLVDLVTGNLSGGFPDVVIGLNNIQNENTYLMFLKSE